MKQVLHRKRKVSHRKAMGVHYTPPMLAGFLAHRILQQLDRAPDSVLRILDPACGDGALLKAVVEPLHHTGSAPCEVVGVEPDARAIAAARSSLAQFPRADVDLIVGDFLDLAAGKNSQGELWGTSTTAGRFATPFDIVIANPPYVRTQVLGAERSQELAERFGLTGRVDLYHAFVVAVTEMLRPGGIMGIITSNRFLTTLGGAAVRSFLARHYEIDEVIDLGDTKLFAAAVLPAIFVGRRRNEALRRQSPQRARFLRVYSRRNGTNGGSSSPSPATGLFDVLERGAPGSYSVPEGVFELAKGDLLLGQDPKQLWSLTSSDEADWLDRVRAASSGFFGDVAAVRVGIKTTADEVFIRTDWDDLPREMRPEPALLRPLLRHADAGRWAFPAGFQPQTRILYPHEVSNGSRRAVDLRRYPRAKAYLESHRARLESRPYVLDAGRQWYEIWVPQDPDTWSAPKIVFPDISPEPRFCLDLDGRLVDGDCYWLTLLPHVPKSTIYLLLGLANSALMSRFHDLAFNNRLYSGRRRYITQYVAKYPCPAVRAPATRRLISLTKRMARAAGDKGRGADDHAMDAQIESLIAEAFGLNSHQKAQ